MTLRCWSNRAQEAEQGLINLSDNEPVIVKLLVQYLYEAEYDPILPTPAPLKPGGIAPRTDPHTCAKNPSNYHCNSYGYYRQVCPHHSCGSQCSYNCNNFVCDKCATVTGDADQMLTHSKMYEIADKYDVSGLKQLCIEKYTRACNKFWDDAKFAESAYHAFSTTPTRDKGLRNIVCKTISQHMTLLKKPEVEDLMNEFNGLAFGLLFDKAEQAGWCD